MGGAGQVVLMRPDTCSRLRIPLVRGVQTGPQVQMQGDLPHREGPIRATELAAGQR